MQLIYLIETMKLPIEHITRKLHNVLRIGGELPYNKRYAYKKLGL